MKDYEKEFYAQIGFLSIKFSKMEYKLSVIVSELLGVDEDLVAVTITEKNNLSQNLELLSKLNQLKAYKETEINDLSTKIKKIQSNRNLFIHGIWQDPFESEKGVEVVCEERKIKYSVTKRNKLGRVINQEWSVNRFHSFELQDIKNLINIIDELIVTEDELIKALKKQNNK